MSLAILNTTIMTGGAGTYRLSTATIEEAAAAVAESGVQSHVGHESTAALISSLLGVEVPMDRTPFNAAQHTGRVLMVKLRGRAPEGVILTSAEIEEIGVDLYWCTYTPGASMTTEIKCPQGRPDDSGEPRYEFCKPEVMGNPILRSPSQKSSAFTVSDTGLAIEALIAQFAEGDVT